MAELARNLGIIRTVLEGSDPVYSTCRSSVTSLTLDSGQAQRFRVSDREHLYQ